MHRPDVMDPPLGDPALVLDEWRSRLDHLAARIKTWAERSGWRTRLIEKPMSDSRLGTYRAPVLLMQRETVEVILDPVGRFAPGTDGVVDLYLLPAYDDIASLYLVEGEWSLNHAFRKSAGVAGIKQAESMRLEESTLTRVLDDLTSHVA